MSVLRRYSFLICLLTVALVLSAVSIAQTTDGLVAHWPFDGDATDATGNGHDGTEYSVHSYTRGHIGQAIHLDGTGYVEVLDHPSLDVGEDDFTVAAWIRRDTTGTAHMIVSKYEDLIRGWNLYAQSNDRALLGGRVSESESHDSGDSSTVIGASEWFHIVGRRASGSLELEVWVNGVQENEGTSFSGSMAAPGIPLNIGRQTVSGAGKFDGLIDDVRLYDRALGANEISCLVYPNDDPDNDGWCGALDNCPSNFNLDQNDVDGDGTGDACDSTDDSLLAYYPFDGNTDDASGNGQHGSNQGAVAIADRFGTPSGALHFDGTDAYVDLPDLGNTRTVTLNVWAYDQNSYEWYFGILFRGNMEYDDNSGWDFRMGKGWDFASTRTTDSHDHATAEHIEEDVWHNYTYTLHDIPEGLVSSAMYTDGVFLSEEVEGDSVPNGHSEWFIAAGGRHHDNNHANKTFWGGRLDEVRIYDRVLASSEISCLVYPSDDPDSDGWCGSLDNCPGTFNPNQVDSDGDGIGNSCDDDSQILYEGDVFPDQATPAWAEGGNIDGHLDSDAGAADGKVYDLAVTSSGTWKQEGSRLAAWDHESGWALELGHRALSNSDAVSLASKHNNDDSDLVRIKDGHTTIDVDFRVGEVRVNTNLYNGHACSEDPDNCAFFSVASDAYVNLRLEAKDSDLRVILDGEERARLKTVSSPAAKRLAFGNSSGSFNSHARWDYLRLYMDTDLDPDGDGVASPQDNCPEDSNAGQQDADYDGIGDACDGFTVSSVDPGDNALDVPLYANVTVSFEEPADAATVGDTDADGTSDTFKVYAAGTPIAGVVEVSPDGLSATFDPVDQLAASTRHRVELTDAVRGEGGQVLTPFESHFDSAADTSQNESNLGDVPAESEAEGEQQGERHGSALSDAGDIDHDGFDDRLVGAPGYSDAKGVGAGRVSLYLGSGDGQYADVPAVVWEGVSAGDALGVSVSGGEDVDGDGTLDVVLGADQHDGSTATGSGLAYVIFFDPADYPNLSDPQVTDTVSVSSVSSATLEGGALSDRAGHSVDLSADLNGDGYADLLVGAPDADRDGSVDRGEVYVLFGDPAWSGTIDLLQVGEPEPGGVDGLTYLGRAAGDRLGWSVSGGGDFDADGYPDLMMGAPHADVDDGTDGDLFHAGISYIDLEGPLMRGIIEVDSIGLDPGRIGVQLVGDQAGQLLGQSVALVPDHDGDGLADALHGAPGSSVGGEAEAGEVFLELGIPKAIFGRGIIEVDKVRDPAEGLGVAFQGTDAGDQLGTAVGSAGDVDGDGLGETLMGAPGMDVGDPPNNDAGGLFLEMGQLNLGRGIIEVDKIGVDRPGAVYVGVGAGDEAGESASGVGDSDGDGQDDFMIGAPSQDADATVDSGASYLVTEEPAPVPEGPPVCGADGCTVTDLDTGGEIIVAAGSLSEDVEIQVGGILAPASLPGPEPDERTLLGAAEYSPDGQSFSPPDPVISLPTRSKIESQLTLGESFDLFYWDGASWVDSGRDGTVIDNAHVADRLAVSGEADLLRVWAVFIVDQDLDGTRDSKDSDDDGDGVDDVSDNCLGLYNPGQADCDGDGTGDACDGGASDSDGDEVADACDNCIDAWNNDQADIDEDGLGDVCDACIHESPNDVDGDGVCCPKDNCCNDSNADQLDSDGDDAGDVCDPCPFENPDDADDDGVCCPEDNCCNVSNASQKDRDDDGVGDACDSNPELFVSSDPADNADFSQIQDAVDTSTESGTLIHIYPGSGPYLESIVVDREQAIYFVAVPPDPGTDDDTPVIVDGGLSPAFDLRSTLSGKAMRLQGLTLRGSDGAQTSVSTDLNGLKVESPSGMGLDLQAGSHDLRDIEISSSGGVALAVHDGASLLADELRIDGAGDVGVSVDGSAELKASVITLSSSSGIAIGATGSLVLTSATVADSGDRGVDNSQGGTAEVHDSIVWGNTSADLDGIACAQVHASDTGSPNCDGINDNISEDPIFEADYSLGDGSPCLDTGPDPSAYNGQPCYDSAGGPRLRDADGDGLAKRDMGGLERENASLSPAVVTGLVFIGRHTLTWDSTASATEYHVYRDDLTTLGYSAFATCRDDLDASRSDTQLIDETVPAVGIGWYYNITAEDGGGEEGTLGLGTCAERSHFTPCP